MVKTFVSVVKPENVEVIIYATTGGGMARVAAMTTITEFPVSPLGMPVERVIIVFEKGEA